MLRICYLSLLFFVGHLFAPTPAFALTKAEIQTRKGEKTRVPSSAVGRAVTQAFELFNQKNTQGALDLLINVKTSNQYDQAFLDRFIGNLHVTVEGHTKEALEWLLASAKPDILNYKEQSENIKIVAQLYMKQKQYLEAIDWYRQWMKFTGEQDAKVYTRIASAYYELKQYPNILYPANKAIELSKGLDKTPYSLKMSAYYESGDMHNATKVGQQILDLDPKDDRNRITVGQLYITTGENDKAFTVLKSAYEMGILTKATPLLIYAKLHVLKEMPDQCVDLIQKHLKAGQLEEDSSTWNVMAFCYEKQQSYKLAAKYFKMVADSKGTPGFLVKQGEMLIKAKQHAQAVKALHQALEKLTEGREQACLYLAQAYFHQKNWAKSEEYLKLAHKDTQLTDEVKKLRGKIAKAK